MTRLIALLASILLTPVAHAQWVLNGQGANGRYQVYQVQEDGSFMDPTLIISPSGAGFDAASVYWPSAVRVNGSTYVYATANDGQGNLSLGLWVSGEGGAFRRVGQVLGAEGDEGQIGSAHVIYDPSTGPAPFHMWYGTKYGPRSMEIRYAVSNDGVNWVRMGTALAASEPYESAGFQLDYVCNDAGQWRMFYSASNDPANRFHAVEARANAAGGPYVKRGVVFEPGGTSHQVVSTVTPGSRYLKLDTTNGLVEGGVYALSNGVVSERVVIEEIMNAREASIEDAMVSSGEGFSLRSAHYRKTGISVFYRDGHEARVLFTGWGAFPAGLQEYVYEGREVSGLYQIDPDSENRFKPTGPGSLYSFENPSPVTAGASCALN